MEKAELNKLLKQKRILTGEALATLEKDANSSKLSWEEFLLDQHAITEDQLLDIKAGLLGVAVVDIRAEKIPSEVLNLVPEPIARRHKILSFAKTKTELSLAMVDPTDLQIKDFMQKKTGLAIKPFLMGQSGLEDGLSKYHSNLAGELKTLVSGPAPDIKTSDGKSDASDAQGLKKMSEEVPVIRIVDTLLEYAIFEKASDIHIEPTELAVIVRYRIDGILHDVMTLPKIIQTALIARIKVLSNLKIDEHRLPQDGRFKVEKDGFKYSLRVSTIPVFDGEKVVMRLLDETTKAMSLEQLGFMPDQLEVVMRAIHRPHGIMLITGPTGSGKSTTLYAILTLLNTRGVNISTIEDPIEYHIEGANQMQVNPKISLTFALGLRALLRQDPNIIMIGEIRDKETAEEAMHAAMTGHVVLSTLHTNSAAGALPRLLDIGIEPYLIASTTNAVMGQRLVRVLCPECKVPFQPDETLAGALAKEFNLEKLMALYKKLRLLPKGAEHFTDLTFYKPKGCDKCNPSGYKSRIGIHEILEVTEEVGPSILAKASAQEIQDKAEASGMILIWQDGFIKALAGQTSIDEVLRVSKE